MTFPGSPAPHPPVQAAITQGAPTEALLVPVHLMVAWGEASGVPPRSTDEGRRGGLVRRPHYLCQVHPQGLRRGRALQRPKSLSSVFRGPTAPTTRGGQGNEYKHTLLWQMLQNTQAPEPAVGARPQPWGPWLLPVHLAALRQVQ